MERAFDSHLEAKLVSALRRTASPQLSVVAEVDGEILGHVFYSPVTIESPMESTVEMPAFAQLSPLAVRPDFQRQGIGSTLTIESLKMCRKTGWQAVFLVGDPRYYSRFGFDLAGPLGISYPGPHDPYLQYLELEPGALEGVSGAIKLHPAFAEVGAE